MTKQVEVQLDDENRELAMMELRLAASHAGGHDAGGVTYAGCEAMRKSIERRGSIRAMEGELRSMSEAEVLRLVAVIMEGGAK